MIAARYEFATPAYVESLALRQMVLRQPLGRSIWDDPLGEEWDQLHLGLFTAKGGALPLGSLAATASLVRSEKAYKMRQVAVHPVLAGQGLGRRLVRFTEQLVGEDIELYCHAREVARAFYAACGWEAFGEPFTEVDIPHIRMRSTHSA